MVGSSTVNSLDHIRTRKDAEMKCTQAQFDSLVKVYLRWQDKTPHAIMPDDGVEIIPDEDNDIGDYIGVWVGGGPVPNSAIYLGIEKDGHTHS